VTQRVVVGALVALALLPLVLLSAWAAVRIPTVWAGDYLTYVAGGERLLAGEPLYPAFQLEGPFILGTAAFGRGFVYPPTAAVASVPFAVLGPDLGFAVFAVLSAVLLGVTTGLVGRREGLSTRASALFGLAFVLSASGIEAIATGQANTLVAASIAATWVWPRATGWLAVIGGLIKLFPLASLAWAVRERAPIVRPLLAGALLVAASVLLMGWDTWQAFITTLRNGQGWDLTVVPSPRELLGSVLGPGTVATLAGYAIAGALALASLVVPSRYAAFAMVALAMIVPAPDWYLHYLLIPLAGLAPWIAARLVGFGRVWAASGAGPVTA
jgi:hypothetical protein